MKSMQSDEVNILCQLLEHKGFTMCQHYLLRWFDMRNIARLTFDLLNELFIFIRRRRTDNIVYNHTRAARRCCRRTFTGRYMKHLL